MAEDLISFFDVFGLGPGVTMFVLILIGLHVLAVVSLSFVVCFVRVLSRRCIDLLGNFFRCRRQSKQEKIYGKETNVACISTTELSMR